MARMKRVFREWQHPRDARGRFSRKGGEAWAKRAAKQVAEHIEQRPKVPSAPGRPRIGAKAKAGAILNTHVPGAGDTLSVKFNRTPPGTKLQSYAEVRTLKEKVQVQHEGHWREVIGSGSGTDKAGNYSEYLLIRGDRAGQSVELPNTGKPFLTKPYKTEFHEPLRPSQAKIMEAWRADAAKPPAMRQKTKHEETQDEARRELEQAQAALKEAQRKARNRANRKYPNKEGYGSYTRNDYIERETFREQHDVTLAEYRVKLFEGPPAASQQYLNRPGDRLPELTGELNRDRPLAVYGDLMHISADDQATFRHLADLELVPAELHAIVARSMQHDRLRQAAHGGGKGTGVWLGSKPVSELDHAEDLADKRPRGWGENDTWGDVDGAFRSHSNTLIAGVSKQSQRRGEHGQPALHEFGHALDNAVGDLLRQDDLNAPRVASEDPAWVAIWKQVVAAAPDMNPYFRQASGGAEEMWAEAFAEWAGARARVRTRNREERARRGRWFDVSPNELQHAGEFAMRREFRIPQEQQVAASALNAYFEGLVKRLGVDL